MPISLAQSDMGYDIHFAVYATRISLLSVFAGGLSLLIGTATGIQGYLRGWVDDMIRGYRYYPDNSENSCIILIAAYASGIWI